MLVAINLISDEMGQKLLSDEICLFLDVDGTLIDLAPRPQDVAVPQSLRGDLLRATQKLHGALALISGRSVDAIDRLFHPLRLCTAGVHGAELRLVPDAEVVQAPSALLRVDLRRKLVALAQRFPGAIAEDKGASVAMHYRACADRRIEMLAAIDSELARQADPRLVILPGHFVFEVKHKGYDKGTAVAAFLDTAAFHGRLPVMIGDDVTDEAGFRTAIARGGYGFSVGRDVEGASGRFDQAEDVRRWLALVASEWSGPSVSLLPNRKTGV